MELTWRQTTSYSIQSGCGEYRIAKCRTQWGWRYIPFVAEDCMNAYGNTVKRWYPITKPVRTADEAKQECEKWSQNKKS